MGHGVVVARDDRERLTLQHLLVVRARGDLTRGVAVAVLVVGHHGARVGGGVVAQGDVDAAAVEVTTRGDQIAVPGHGPAPGGGEHAAGTAVAGHVVLGVAATGDVQEERRDASRVLGGGTGLVADRVLDVDLPRRVTGVHDVPQRVPPVGGADQV